ncbi:MAG: hypothetical protein OXB84_06285, partial [Halobacteriovoraceae bacterium]|nr:hypothetical protein [Halobacteriovoraceae bacterium]
GVNQMKILAFMVVAAFISPAVWASGTGESPFCDHSFEGVAQESLTDLAEWGYQCFETEIQVQGKTSAESYECILKKEVTIQFSVYLEDDGCLGAEVIASSPGFLHKASGSGYGILNMQLVRAHEALLEYEE